MARVVATASLAVLLLFSLLAVANCRVLLKAEPDTDGASSVVAVVHEEQRTPNPVDDSGDKADAAQVIPATVAVGEGFLRLPSYKRNRRPCHHGQGRLFHQHLSWARNHGLSHRHGDALADNLPTELSHEEERRELEKKNKVQAVAEPDPDSHPDTDGENEVGEEETMKPFHGEEADDDDELTKAWKGKMLRRFRLRFHHHHHLQHHHHHEEDDAEHNKEDAAGAAKRLIHFHHHGGEEKMTSKRFHRDSDREDGEEGEEEMAKHWRKAIMRGRFHHGRRRRHHHPRAEEDQKEGGVKWFLDLMNRF